MGVVPKKPLQKILYYEAHIAPWTSHAAAIGLSGPEVTDLDTKTQAARSALDAQVAARQASKVATQALKDAVNAMGDAGSALMKKIRGKAEQVGGNSVYNLAEIPPPAPPTPKGDPGTPNQLKVTLDGDGSLIMKWKCNNPPGTSGTIYQIFRRIGPSGEYAYLGGVGEKKYVDQSVPAGATSLTYQIQAVRTTAAGLFATFNVFFGTNAGGMMVASVTEVPDAPKIAA